MAATPTESRARGKFQHPRLVVSILFSSFASKFFKAKEMIKNIVFDFGNVLVLHDFISYFAEFFHSEEKARWFFKHPIPPGFSDEVDRELHPFRYYIERQQQLWPEYKDALDLFDTHFADFFTGEVPGMRELMTELKGEDYRLLGLSNWSSKVNDVMARFPDIFSLLEGSLISYTVHQLKPEREIYETFLRKFGVEASECVFIDDRPANIEGCRKVGMHGIVFSNTEQLRNDLRQLLDAQK